VSAIPVDLWHGSISWFLRWYGNSCFWKGQFWTSAILKQLPLFFFELFFGVPNFLKWNAGFFYNSKFINLYSFHSNLCLGILNNI
jgi:uncharacterized membrane protein YobD (UPF0266 family)